LINARSCLVSSFKLTLEKALDLLGITAPQRM
jgi:arginyl-tRNA synthetase